jgi:hypothetical protein
MGLAWRSAADNGHRDLTLKPGFGASYFAVSVLHKGEYALLGRLAYRLTVVQATPALALCPRWLSRGRPTCAALARTDDRLPIRGAASGYSRRLLSRRRVRRAFTATQWRATAASGFCFASWVKDLGDAVSSDRSTAERLSPINSAWPPNTLLPMIQYTMSLKGCSHRQLVRCGRLQSIV